MTIVVNIIGTATHLHPHTSPDAQASCALLQSDRAKWRFGHAHTAYHHAGGCPQ
ncbi:hypothetical protein [uncultured Tateyamaria sp.]|uniref:hypothetical protein n=1 Tax=Tateyamaria sp. 1078 TaxID=3417464 RepID=UPI00261D4F22|nr:hypothetical protein [uncultured Tateyamaria sp.]